MNNANLDIELKWTGKDSIFNAVGCSLKLIDEKSYGDKSSNNLLIHGDNLLVISCLIQKFSSMVKCIIIDPPYNSSIEYEHYSDNLDHSTWLCSMSSRLRLLRELLCDDGFIFVQIDNRELHYLKVLMDEVFGRDNYRNSLIVNKGLDVLSSSNRVFQFRTGYDTILVYSKTPTTLMNVYYKNLTDSEIKGVWRNFWRGNKNPKLQYTLFNITPQKGEWRWDEAYAKRATNNYFELSSYLSENQIQLETQKQFDDYLRDYLSKKNITIDEYPLLRRRGVHIEYYIAPNRQVPLNDNWMDLRIEGDITGFEHEVSEMLLHRILNCFTAPGDIVLDAYLGAATTSAVAHKMKRTWIGIEKEEHCYTCCIPRMQKVIDGDNTELSIQLQWSGGGGFKFFEVET